MPIEIKVQPEIEWEPVAKVGSFEVDWDITKKPAILDRLITEMTRKFIRDMELQGLKFFDKLPENPTVVSHEDGTPMAYYAIDWEAKPDIAEDGGPLPPTRPTSLEESKGMVEFRIIGVFLAPKLPVEIGTTLEEIHAKEKERRKPVTFGYGKQPGTGLWVPPDDSVSDAGV